MRNDPNAQSMGQKRWSALLLTHSHSFQKKQNKKTKKKQTKKQKKTNIYKDIRSSLEICKKFSARRTWERRSSNVISKSTGARRRQASRISVTLCQWPRLRMWVCMCCCCCCWLSLLLLLFFLVRVFSAGFLSSMWITHRQEPNKQKGTTRDNNSNK